MKKTFLVDKLFENELKPASCTLSHVNANTASTVETLVRKKLIKFIDLNIYFVRIYTGF